MGESLENILGMWLQNLKQSARIANPYFTVFSYQFLGGLVGGFGAAALSGFSGNDSAINSGIIIGLIGGTLFGYYRAKK